jgi:hypothetical protein
LADDPRAQDEGTVDEGEGEREVKENPAQDEAASGESTVSTLDYFKPATCLLQLGYGCVRVAIGAPLWS